MEFSFVAVQAERGRNVELSTAYPKEVQSST
jgi:hypothetical protein